jgi:type IV pilus assembly protein PilW
VEQLMRGAPVTGRRERGMTLLELMISMTIGLVILGAMSYLYVGTRGVYRVNESLARVQEAGRMALDFLQEDARAGGFLGCRSRNMPNAQMLMLARPAIPLAGSADSVRGFEDGGGWVNPSLIPRLRGDVLSVRRATGIGDELAANTDTAAATITLKNNCSGLTKGDYVALGSCDRLVIARVTNSPAQTCSPAMAPVVVEHGVSGAGVDGLGGNGSNGVVSGPDSHRIVPQFNLDSRAVAFKFEDVSYFIGGNPAGRPALYRATFEGAVEELVEHVEDLDLVFGVDTSVPADGIADDYRRADAVGDWSQVVSVRATLVVLGPEDNVTTSPQIYAFGTTTSGTVATVTAPDARLRQVFSTTITLRNRLP